MIEIVKFKAEHWDQMEGQETTAHLTPLIPREQMSALTGSPYSYTLFSGDRIVAVAGVLEYWPGRGEAWAELAQVCRKDFLAIHNAAKRFLDVCPFVRVEATVDVDFVAAHRWAKLLGFEMEAPVMKKYGVDGHNYSLYARTR
jgi:hypothetical protein